MNRTLLTKQLLLHEGLRLKPYQDATGHWTIGVGRNLTDHGISEDEARMLLDNDITATFQACTIRIPCFGSLDDDRQAVLVDMAFNLGMDGLLQFRQMLAAVEARDFERAGDAMLQSAWAKQVGQRAIDLSLQMKGSS